MTVFLAEYTGHYLTVRAFASHAAASPSVYAGWKQRRTTPIAAPPGLGTGVYVWVWGDWRSAKALPLDILADVLSEQPRWRVLS